MPGCLRLKCTDNGIPNSIPVPNVLIRVAFRSSLLHVHNKIFIHAQARHDPSAVGALSGMCCDWPNSTSPQSPAPLCRNTCLCLNGKMSRSLDHRLNTHVYDPASSKLRPGTLHSIDSVSFATLGDCFSALACQRHSCIRPDSQTGHVR